MVGHASTSQAPTHAFVNQVVQGVPKVDNQFSVCVLNDESELEKYN